MPLQHRNAQQSQSHDQVTPGLARSGRVRCGAHRIVCPHLVLQASGARGHVSADKDAPLSEFEQVAAQYPVFRVLAEA